MTGSYVIPAVIAALGVLFFTHALIVRRRPGLASAVLLLSALGSSASVSQTLGFCKPIAWEFFPPAELNLAGLQFEEGTAIHLWLSTSEGPRCYSLPWDLQAAKQLYQAQQQAETDGTGVRIEGLFDGSDGELVAHAEPIQALPPKMESAP